jgi:hypothetical protein
MTTGGVAFWIYLGAFVNMGGGAGLVLWRDRQIRGPTL